MNVLTRPASAARPAEAERTANDRQLFAISRLSPAEACDAVASSADGLAQDEAEVRQERYGPNTVSREHRATVLEELWARARNPLNGLLLVLAGVSFFLGDVRAAIVIAAMVVLSITT